MRPRELDQFDHDVAHWMRVAQQSNHMADAALEKIRQSERVLEAALSIKPTYRATPA